MATVNKITASIKSPLPVALPASAQAAIITDGNAKLYLNYSELFTCAIQTLIIITFLIVLIWLCIQMWNCTSTRNLGKLEEKLSFMKFLYIDKTDLYFQFMSNYMSCSVYLGSVYDTPEGIEIIG